MIDVHLNQRLIFRPVMFFVIIATFWFGMSLAVAGQPQSTEPLISITAVNEPLGQVLDKIGAEIKYTFELDELWQDHPVTIAVDGVPLNEGLKRILVSLNHAIIYENDTTIRIAILVEDEDIKTGGAAPDRSYRGSAEPIPSFQGRMPDAPDNRGDAEEQSSADAPPDTPADDSEQ